MNFSFFSQTKHSHKSHNLEKDLHLVFSEHSQENGCIGPKSKEKSYLRLLIGKSPKPDITFITNISLEEPP